MTKDLKTLPDDEVKACWNLHYALAEAAYKRLREISAAVVSHHFTPEWFPKWKHVVKSDEMKHPDYRVAAPRITAHYLA